MQIFSQSTNRYFRLRIESPHLNANDNLATTIANLSNISNWLCLIDFKRTKIPISFASQQFILVQPTKFQLQIHHSTQPISVLTFQRKGQRHSHINNKYCFRLTFYFVVNCFMAVFICVVLTVNGITSVRLRLPVIVPRSLKHIRSHNVVWHTFFSFIDRKTEKSINLKFIHPAPFFFVYCRNYS